MKLLCWSLWGIIFNCVIAAYIYSIISGIELIPLYSVVLDLILFLVIIILSVIKKNIFYFKRFTFFFIVLYTANSTYILLKKYIVDNDSNVNLNSTSSILSSNINELIPIILLIFLPILSYFACLFSEKNSRTKLDLKNTVVRKNNK